MAFRDDGHEDIVVRVDHIGESYACLQCDDGRRDSFGVVRVVCCPDAAAHGIAQLIPLQLVEPGPESVAHLCGKGPRSAAVPEMIVCQQVYFPFRKFNK